MRVPAENFLASRAFGAPPIVIALAAQGAFRGFMDTKTPLYAIGKYCSYLFSLSFGLAGYIYIYVHKCTHVRISLDGIFYTIFR